MAVHLNGDSSVGCVIVVAMELLGFYNNNSNNNNNNSNSNILLYNSPDSVDSEKTVDKV